MTEASASVCLILATALHDNYETECFDQTVLRLFSKYKILPAIPHLQ